MPRAVEPDGGADVATDDGADVAIAADTYLAVPAEDDPNDPAYRRANL